MLRKWLSDPGRRSELRDKVDGQRAEQERERLAAEREQRLVVAYRKAGAAWDAFREEDPHTFALVNRNSPHGLAKAPTPEVQSWVAAHVIVPVRGPRGRKRALERAMQRDDVPPEVVEAVRKHRPDLCPPAPEPEQAAAPVEAREPPPPKREPNWGLTPEQLPRAARLYGGDLLLAAFDVIRADPHPEGTAKLWFARDEGRELSASELVAEVARRAELNGVPFEPRSTPAG